MRNAFELFIFGRVAKRQPPEGVLRKKVFLKFSQNFQEKICPRVSFIIKLKNEASNFIKKEALVQVFSYEFYKTFKDIYFEEHLLTTACGCRLENHVEIEPLVLFTLTSLYLVVFFYLLSFI